MEDRFGFRPRKRLAVSRDDEINPADFADSSNNAVFEIGLVRIERDVADDSISATITVPPVLKNSWNSPAFPLP